MHIFAYIYLLIKRSSFPFLQLYMAGTARVIRMKKSCREKLLNIYKAFSEFHTRSIASRSHSPFRNKFLHLIEYFNPLKYWHCKIRNHWQISRIIRYQLPQYIQPPDMVLSGSIKTRSSDPECQRLQVDASNCLPALFNFLTPHMRFQSSSHTDVPAHKTQPSKERINK